jgi:hypothetical protein
VYQYALYPVTKSSAKFLDWWLGPESIQYFREYTIRELIKMHMEADGADIDRIEGLGALNFLAIDDLLVTQEGEPLDPKSIIALTFKKGVPHFPTHHTPQFGSFIKRIESSGKKWIILTDTDNKPRLALNSDSFLRSVFFHTQHVNPMTHCHRPILLSDGNIALGDVLTKLKVHPERSDDDVIDDDLIILWGNTKKVITGADILGRLLRGIADRPSTT